MFLLGLWRDINRIYDTEIHRETYYLPLKLQVTSVSDALYAIPIIIPAAPASYIYINVRYQFP
jgi:hypothetical protein